MHTPQKTERYLAPKELMWSLQEYGIFGFDERKCRKLAVVLSVERPGSVVCKTQCRLDEALVWLRANPSWRPFSKKRGPSN